MALKNYIFIFLFFFFGLIESKGAFTAGSDTIASFGPAVVINELMVDPSPVVGLPDREYIELHNAGTGTVNLKGWVLGLGTKQKTFPDVALTPGGYLLLTATGGTKDFQASGKVLEISGLSLANSGVVVSLSDNLKVEIDRLEYLPSMHNSQCRDGGYSLERIDPTRMCGQFYNWETTLSARGGTPGAENSVRAVNRDRMAPSVLSSVFLNGTMLEVQFSERFQFPGNPPNSLLNLPFNALIDSIVQDKAACTLRIHFRPSTILEGISYSLVLHGLEDECGNTMPDKRVKFGYYTPVRSDILITEVLFNPYPEGTDFVEIFNNSLHEVDLSGLFLATRGEDKQLRQPTPVSQRHEYLASRSYLAITKSIDGIERFYTLKCPDCLIQTAKFPTLSDESGCVVLLGNNQAIIDEMEYDDNMHHPFITEKEGISLERINLSGSAVQRENWLSAAKNAGFATPGYKNSVQEIADSAAQQVSVEPAVFSPNGDGIHDEVTIGLKEVGAGEIVNVTVLDAAGREVKTLANNLTTGREDRLLWDGTDSCYRKVQPGIYILNVSIFHRGGKQRTWRHACVVTDHL